MLLEKRLHEFESKPIPVGSMAYPSEEFSDVKCRYRKLVGGLHLYRWIAGIENRFTRDAVMNIYMLTCHLYREKLRKRAKILANLELNERL